MHSYVASLNVIDCTIITAKQQLMLQGYILSMSRCI